MSDLYPDWEIYYTLLVHCLSGMKKWFTMKGIGNPVKRFDIYSSHFIRLLNDFTVQAFCKLATLTMNSLKILNIPKPLVHEAGMGAVAAPSVG